MKFHTSANGSRSLISQLSDDHLKNTISLIFTRLRTAKTIVKNATTTENIDLIGSGISISDMKEEAERKIEQILETLPFYIYEATIRGFKYTEELQEIHDRKEQLDFIGTALLL